MAVHRFLALFLVVSCALCFVNYSYGQRAVELMNLSEALGHGRLGVMIQDVTPRLAKDKNLSVSSGAYVTDVVEESPADEAGIEEGDVIVKFGDRQIDDSGDLTNAVRKVKAATDIKIEVLRKGDHKTLTATLPKERRRSEYSFNFTPPRVPKIPPMHFRFRSFMQEDIEGMNVEEISKQLADYFEVPSHRGLLVVEVRAGSEADKAGVKAGDVLIKVNDESVRDIEGLRDGLSDAKNHESSLEIIRKGKTVSLKIHVEGDDEDDDALLNGIQTTPCPDHTSAGVRGKIFSKDFLRDMLQSLEEIKDSIFHSIEATTSHIRASFAKLWIKKENTSIPIRQS